MKKYRVVSDSVLTHAGRAYQAGDEVEGDPNASHIKVWLKFGQIEAIEEPTAPAEGEKKPDGSGDSGGDKPKEKKGK